MPIRFNTSRRGMFRAQTMLRSYPEVFATDVDYDAKHGAYNGTTPAQAVGNLVGTVGVAAATEFLKMEQLRQQQETERIRLQEETRKAQELAATMESVKTAAMWVAGGFLVLGAARYFSNLSTTRSS